MAKLTVLFDNRPTQVISITDIITIGRDSNNDIQIIDVKVSRRHSAVERRKGFYVLKDLGSRNGTFLNGVQVKESNLTSGDRIRVGETEILFEGDGVSDFMPVFGEEFSASDSSNPLTILDHTFEIKNLADIVSAQDDKNQLRKTFEKFTTLMEVNNIINTARDFNTLVEEVLTQITRVIKADRSYLLIKDEKTGELKPVAIRTYEKSDSTPKLSNTILDQVINEGISILSPDAFQDARFQGSESIFIHSMRSVMCVPLRCREKILGVIHVDTKGAFNTFSEDDLKMLTAVGISAGIALENMMLYENLKRLFKSTVKSLVATIEANDQYTGGHSVRVAEYTKQIAICLGLPEDEIQNIELAAFLHDVGKVGIPDNILNKAGRFDSRELMIMESHPETGAEILSKIEGMEHIANMVRHHHEKYDGSGYPDKLKGEQIPLGSRIMCVADSVDAMTTDRAYRKRLDVEVTLRELESNAGTQFDPEVVKAFKKCLAIGAIKI